MQVLVIGSVFSLFVVPGISFAGTNVTSTATYAWGDVLGWVNFSPTNGNVTVTNNALTGYAWSANYGWINLNPTNGGVINDGTGNLSGNAWGAQTGWVDFTGVVINSSGQFTGHTASSTLVGVINFSCANCLVTTTWRPASQTVPPSTSSSGSYAGGGFSQVPYALTASTTSTTTAPNNLKKHTNTETSQSTSLQPASGNDGYGGISTSTNSSSHPYNYLSSTTQSRPSFWDNISSSIPNFVKVIGGVIVVLLIILILWRLIVL